MIPTSSSAKYCQKFASTVTAAPPARGASRRQCGSAESFAPAPPGAAYGHPPGGGPWKCGGGAGTKFTGPRRRISLIISPIDCLLAVEKVEYALRTRLLPQEAHLLRQKPQAPRFSSRAVTFPHRAQRYSKIGIPIDPESRKTGAV